MIEVFQPPRITREETAYKMLFHVFAAFAALAVSMAGLFYSMAGDSRKNRDALHKVTSPETELWAIIVFAVFVLAAVYLSVAGVVLSRRVRGQFVRWVKKGGKLYFVSASASNVRASGSSRRISSSLKLQDASLNVLNDIKRKNCICLYPGNTGDKCHLGSAEETWHKGVFPKQKGISI